MRHKIILLCVATFMSIAQSFGGVTLTVPEVNITPGGTSYVVIYFDLGTDAYTAYQLDITYPEGISSVIGNDGNPEFQKGDVYSESHNVSSIYTTNGLDRFQCFSVNSVPLSAQNGTLLILPIKAKKLMSEGTYQATISPIEFVQTNATPDRPDAITFNINVSNQVVLDELSTLAPPSATSVNVIVKRTLKANEWSTICLPFAMTEEQVKSAFGDDVQLADFVGCVTTTDTEDNVLGIKVNFSEVSAIEANHPYIIKVSAPISYEDGFTVYDVNIAPSEELFVNRDETKMKIGSKTYYFYNSYVGTYIANTIVPENGLFLNDNKFWYSAGKTKIKAFRGYFEFIDVLTDKNGAGVKMYLGNDETFITDLNINADDTIYDLGGRKVMKTQQRGVYIINGQKVVVK